MINTIIATFVALFFWGKSTKDVEEKTQFASITRTIVYLFLSIIVGVFFYKSYQVATVFSMAQIAGFRESRDTAGNLADTISYVKIENRFGSSNITNQVYKNWEVGNRDLMEREAGGLFCNICLQRKAPYVVKTNPNFTDADIARLKIPLNNLGQVYEITMVNTAIPNFFSIMPKIKAKEQKVEGIYYFNIEMGELKDYSRYSSRVQHKDEDRHTYYSEAEGNPFTTGYYEDMVVAASFDGAEEGEPYNIFRGSLKSTFINAMGFFTAADVSQYIHVIQINTNCHIDYVDFTYDIPIEISQLDSCMNVGPLGFGFKGDFPDKNFKNQSAAFHVKLPTLSNLQLIRSLILTTLITALLSLFFMNLFYVIRKYSILFREKHAKDINELQVKKYIRRMYILLIILLVGLSYWAWIVYHDTPISINIELYEFIEEYYVYIILCFILLLFVISYILFRKSYSSKRKE